MLARGDERGAPAAYRFFDEDGELLAMRTDMTVPIARLVATRFGDAEPPFRLCYAGNAYRAIRPQRGQMREFLQAGVELIGVEAPDGTAEVIEVLAAALDAVGLTRAVIGLGDADLYRQLLAEHGVSDERRESILRVLAGHDLVGPRGRGRPAGDRSPGSARRCCACPPCGAAARFSIERRQLGGVAVDRAIQRLATTHDALVARGVADRVQLDLGLLRDLGYYTGAIVEVYDPAVGHVLGGGGRYDELMGRFGWPLPAAGFALHLERVHIAQAEEERLGRAPARTDAGARPGEARGGLRLARQGGGRAEARRPARGAVRGHPRPPRQDRGRHRRAPRRVALAGLRRRRAWCW